MRVLSWGSGVGRPAATGHTLHLPTYQDAAFTRALTHRTQREPSIAEPKAKLLGAYA